MHASPLSLPRSGYRIVHAARHQDRLFYCRTNPAAARGRSVLAEKFSCRSASMESQRRGTNSRKEERGRSWGAKRGGRGGGDTDLILAGAFPRFDRSALR